MTILDLIDKHGFVIGPRWRPGVYPLDHPGIRTGWYVYLSWAEAAEDCSNMELPPFAQGDTLEEAVQAAVRRVVTP